MKNTSSIIKQSAQFSFSTIAGISTITGLWGYTIKDISPNHQWWEYGIALLAIALILTLISFLIIYLFKQYRKHKPYKTTINGKPIQIKIGDIFNESGWKVIPFNERFDTIVDDIIISHHSLNGIMIDNHVEDIDDLRSKINLADTDSSPFKSTTIDGNRVYPLGRIIPYKEFLLLSFSHFDNQNRANIEFGEYEQFLFRMWSELRRVYASSQIAIPLVGGGITTIHGLTEKNLTELLKCILCTLRNSKFQPTNGIAVVLTQDVMNQIDMNLIREDF